MASARGRVWQAAAAQYWGAQVEGFNGQVDVVLASLGRQAADHYGATGTGGAPPTVGQVDEARGAATAAARQQWMQAHAVYIEDGRTRLASILQRGPTEANLEALREAGVLPGEQATGSPSGKPADDDDSWSLSSIGHGVLDVAGLIPVFGEPADGANAAWYAAEGDYTNAALSGAAMVPLAGWGATALKGVNKGIDVAQTSRASRREAMSRHGIPRSQQPISQTQTRAGRQYEYELPASGGGTRRVAVTEQTTDRVAGHGPHWEAGTVKPPEIYGRDPLGRLRVRNEGKTKVDYGE